MNLQHLQENVRRGRVRERSEGEEEQEVEEGQDRGRLARRRLEGRRAQPGEGWIIYQMDSSPRDCSERTLIDKDNHLDRKRTKGHAC